MKSDIGECVYVLYHKRWGRTLVDGSLKSRDWWQRRLDGLINQPTITISKEQLGEDWDMPDKPPRYEDEMNLSNEKQG